MKRFYLAISCLLTSMAVMANNIQVSNITASGTNISFTVAWDNSWNTMSNINPLYPNNWDGAWVFIKYQNNIDNLWKHAKVSSTVTDHTISGGILEINTVSDGMGIFLRRTNPGNGSVSATVTLKMNPLTGTGAFNFKVFATEMVYIPQGNFQLGDGQVSGAAYFSSQDIDATKQSGGINAGALFSGSPALSANFPMGYNAYYLMKYELTTEQWVDFLNTLTYDQQANRIDVAPNAVVNTQIYTPTAGTIMDNIIKIQSTGLNNTLPATFGCDLDGDNVYNETNDGQNIAFPMINKADFFAWLDWSGLRPMTELEFEKAGRGTQNRVAGEYAWGSTEIVTKLRTNLSNLGLATEAWTGTVSNGLVMANAGPNPSYGPSRSGVFATGSSGRASAGAGFYGNMELTGNVWEFTIAADATGAPFTGNNGDGLLTVSGNADVLNWPNPTLTTGVQLRGGSWYETSGYNVYTQLSYRALAATAPRTLSLGGRGARTAP